MEKNQITNMKNTLLVIVAVIIGGCSIHMTIGKTDISTKQNKEGNATSLPAKKN